MSERLQLIIDRLDTPIGEMVIIADRDGNLRAVDWTDHEERMLRLLRHHYGIDGFKLDLGKNPHGFADIIKRYLPATFPRPTPYRWKPQALRFNVRSGACSEKFLADIRSATRSWPRKLVNLRPCERWDLQMLQTPSGSLCLVIE
jgi:hypothetical protein